MSTALAALLLAFIVLVQAGARAAPAAACVYSVRWTEEPPYAARGEDGVVRGIDADLVGAILQAMGCAARWLELPWARALIELEAGRLDMLPGAFRTTERESYARFSDPVYLTANALFLGPEARQKFRLKRLEDIIGSDFRLGVVHGSSYGQVFDKLRLNPRFAERMVPLMPGPGRWKMLEAGRIDGLIEDGMSAAMDLRALGLEGKVVRALAVTAGAPSTVAFSRQTIAPATVEAFNTILRRLIADGTYLRIKQRYIPCQPAANPIACS